MGAPNRKDRRSARPAGVSTEPGGKTDDANPESAISLATARISSNENTVPIQVAPPVPSEKKPTINLGWNTTLVALSIISIITTFIFFIAGMKYDVGSLKDDVKDLKGTLKEAEKGLLNEVSERKILETKFNDYVGSKKSNSGKR